VRTIELLKKYSNKAKPFEFLWPELDNEQYETEYKYILSLPKKTFSKLRSLTVTATSNSLELNLKNFQTLADKNINIVKSTMQMRNTDPPFNKEEIRLKDQKVRNVRNLFAEVKNRIKEPDELRDRLMAKFNWDKNMADIMIREYYKFLVIKCKLKEECYPPFNIQNVLYTHMEFTKEYREFSPLIGYSHGKTLFRKIMFRLLEND
jgi:hypothetical protein